MGVHKALVTLVAVMGVLIVLGLIAVGWGIARKSTTGGKDETTIVRPAPGGTGIVDVPLLPGETVTFTFPAGDRLVIVLSGGTEGERVLFADPVSGAVTSILRLQPAAGASE